MTAASPRATARPRTPTSTPEDGSGPDIRQQPPAQPAGRRHGRVPRPVLVIGGLLGSAAAGFMFYEGFRPGHGWWLLLGGFLTLLALAAAGVMAIEFPRRHWRVMGAKSWSGTKGVAARGRARIASRGGEPAGRDYQWLQPGPWLLEITSKSGKPISGGPGAAPGEQPGQPSTVLYVADRNDMVRRLEQIAADDDVGYRVRSVPAPAAPGPQPASQPQSRPRPGAGTALGPKGDKAMSSRSGPDGKVTAPRPVSPRLRGAAAKVIRVPLVRGEAPATWAALIAEIAPFVPEDDEDLLDWFRDQIIGMNGYAEALADVYESCFAQVGLVPAAIGAVHDTADAVAEASGSMAQARQVFAEYFAGFRQWAAEGGEAPFDGRWVTGEGDDT